MQLSAAKGGTRQEYFGLYHKKLHRFFIKGNLAVVYFPNSER